jgi:hypothetical protein
MNQSLISGAGYPYQVAVDDQHVYWTDTISGSVREANLDGTDVTPSFITGVPGAFGVAVSVPMLSVTPSAPAAFAPTPQGELSVPLSLTVKNLGQRDLSITGLSFTGADPGDFVVTSDSCVGSIAPLETCALGISFAPQAQGSRSAWLEIASNDYANSPLQVQLSATGAPAPSGPQGQQGTTGPQGQRGPQGVQGPAGVAGTVVCQNTLLGKILCALEFAPGTYKTHGINAQATFTITHGRRVVVRGTLRLRTAHITIERIQRLRRGRYTLTITVKRGRHDKVLLHEPIVVR